MLERGLQAELTEHLGYDKHDPAGNGSGNSRNGSTPKTLQIEVGPIDLDTPRDRAGTFIPRLVPKGTRRLGGLSDMIISLYAGGMTVRDSGHHLQRVYGTELSHETISKVTDEVSCVKKLAGAAFVTSGSARGVNAVSVAQPARGCWRRSCDWVGYPNGASSGCASGCR